MKVINVERRDTPFRMVCQLTAPSRLEMFGLRGSSPLAVWRRVTLVL
jgi:hypothetical protein